jgi:hypothetical protein
MVAVITTNISSLPQAHRIPFKISCHRRLVELPVSVSHPHREKLPPRDAAAPARFAPASKSPAWICCWRGASVPERPLRSHHWQSEAWNSYAGKYATHHFADSSPQRSRSDDFLQNSIRPERTSPIRVRARKYPVVCLPVSQLMFSVDGDSGCDNGITS